MALFRGVLFNSASGSVDGVTFSHNRGGPYARARVVPVDPMTDEQQAMRQAMTDLADAWRTSLNSGQRAAWQAFANRNRHTNRIGEEKKISGRAEFFRANLVRIQANLWLGIGLAQVDDPSTIGDSTPTSTSFSVVIGNAATAEFELSWDAAEEWNADGGAALLWYISDQQEPVINWFRSPYTLARAVDGGMSGFATATVAAIAPLVSGKRLFWRARITRGDGRLSPPWTGQIEIP